VAQARSEIATLKVQAEEATEAARIAKEELFAARESSQEALSAYLQLDAGTAAERERAASALVAVDRTKLSKLEARALDDKGRAIVQQLANDNLEAGRAAFRRSDWDGTVAALTKALELWPEHPQMDEYSFYLGNAASQSKRWELAADSLQRFVDQAAGRTNKDFAYLLLGQAYDQLGRKEKAEEVLRQGMANYGGSQFYKSMSGLLSRIRRAARTAAAE
jgi:tetratricopeptide (TPR) repeat protein